MVKKKPLFIILIIDVIFIALFVNIRSIPRLAIWNIKTIEDKIFFSSSSNKSDDFNFEKKTSEIGLFNEEIIEVISDKETDLEKIEKILLFLKTNYIDTFRPKDDRLVWGSPLYLKKQVENGARGINCFHFSILFNSYVSSLGYRSRIWALEGDDYLEGFGHTVVEIFLSDLDRWVVFDPSFSIYFSVNNMPIGLLDLKYHIAYNKDDIGIHGFPRYFSRQPIIELYRRLTQLVLLRSSSDFSYKLNDSRLRWGGLFFISGLLSRLPYEAQRGLEMLLGRKEYFYQLKENDNLAFQVLAVRMFILILLIANIYIVLFYLSKKWH